MALSKPKFARALAQLLADADAKVPALAEAGGWHRRTVERWLDPEHPSLPSAPKRRVLEQLLGAPFGSLDQEVPAA